MPNIIFHHPMPLDRNSSSASGIRPIMMLEAFREIGFEVDVVAGDSSERKRASEKVKGKISSGVNYEFMYSESSTMPTLLTDPHHLPIRPFFDFSLFKCCGVNGIPIGLFYRDVYWAFDSYGKGFSKFKKWVAKVFYKYDLCKYNSLVTKMYLPSIEMGKHVPIVEESLFSALPPGCTDRRPFSVPRYNRPLKLFYVGGVSNHYQMHTLFDVVSKMHGVELTICTREVEWASEKSSYPVMGANIKVVHESGAVMKNLLDQSDVTMLFFKPQRYREFAVPVKLYNYIGSGKPVIASRGTLAGQFVESYDIGWSVDYNECALKSLLGDLLSDQSVVVGKAKKAQNLALENTWESRAKQVYMDLVRS